MPFLYFGIWQKGLLFADRSTKNPTGGTHVLWRDSRLMVTFMAFHCSSVSMLRRRFRSVFRCVLVSGASIACAPSAANPVARLEATPETVTWGYYSADARPVLHVDSGDTVEIATLISTLPQRLLKAGLPGDEIQSNLRNVAKSVSDRGPGGHILTGPIFINDAEPGDVLEIQILSIRPEISYGYNACNGVIPENCRDPKRRIFRIDREEKTIDFSPQIVIPFEPFFGSMGVAPPAAAGRWNSNPPWIHAGNIDNKELVAGTRLFIPVHVPGALFSVGDGHAAQGDGEISQMAIETSLRGEFRFIVRKDMHLRWPRAETPSHLIAMGMDEDLMRAAEIAIEETVVLLMETAELDRGSAYVLAGLAADLRITQLVDGYLGVHAMIPKSMFRDSSND